MPSLYSIGAPSVPPTFAARKRDAVKEARELSRASDGAEIEVREIEVCKLPLLDLLAAALNGDGWAKGPGEHIVSFRDGREVCSPAAPEPPPAPPVRIRERPQAPAPRIRERVRA